MLVLTRKNRESVVIAGPDETQVVLEITILEIEGGRVRLGFQADTRMPIHRREVWDRICNGNGNGNGNGSGNGNGNGQAHPSRVEPARAIAVATDQSQRREA
jgi:carbon storage regulator CsrA